MCQTCGCTPCLICGREIVDGACSGCGNPSKDCICKEGEQN